MLGIGFKVSAVGFFLGMQSLLKAADGIPPGEMVFFRSFFAILPIVIFLGWRHELGDGLKTRRPVAHVLRGLVGVCAMGLSFFALTQLPLPEAVSISYAMPLFMVILSALVLKERVRLYRWSAVGLGLIGVGVIMWPRLSVFSGGIQNAEAASVGAIAALAAAAFSAVAMLFVRRLVDTERSPTIVLYFSLTASGIALLTIPFGWVWPSPQHLALLIGAGLCGGIGQIFLTECFRYADMSVIAPFEYVSLIFSILIGYLVFGDVPTVPMITGSLIVVAAGLSIIYREHRLGLERSGARRVSSGN